MTPLLRYLCLTALFGNTSAFMSNPSSYHGKVQSNSNVMSLPYYSNANIVRKKDMSLGVMDVVIDPVNAVVTSTLFGACVWATIKSQSTPIADVIKDVVEKKENKPTKSKEIEVVSQKEENTIIKPVETVSQSNTLKETPTPITTAASKDDDVKVDDTPTWVPANSAKISQVKKNIASTVAGERLKVQRFEETGSQVEVVETAAPAPVTETVVQVDTETKVVKGRKRKFLLKLGKKVLMPWKKWSNL